VEVLLQQTIDGILEEHERVRRIEQEIRESIREAGRDVIAEGRDRRRDGQVGAPIESWYRYG
jgi:hypothetical protein